MTGKVINYDSEQHYIVFAYMIVYPHSKAINEA